LGLKTIYHLIKDSNSDEDMKINVLPG